MTRPNLTLRCGPGGAGKSYMATVWVAEQFLPYEDGRLITNLPLNVPVLCQRVAARHGLEAAKLADRIQLIDRETSERFKTDVSEGGLTPGLHFGEQFNYGGAHLLIDEAHWMIGPDKSESHQALWRSWVGELRHQHATLELMTQGADKLAREVTKECGLKYECVSAEQKRDVFLHIPFSDWAEAWAKVTGKYIPRFYLQEWRNIGSGKFTQQWEATTVYSPYYGEMYNSYSAAGGTTETGVGAAPERFFERLKGWRFWAWLIRRNAAAAGLRLFWWTLGFSVPIGAILFAMQPSKHTPPPYRGPARDLVPIVKSEPREPPEEQAHDGIYEPGSSRIRVVGLLRDAVILADGTVVTEGDKLNGRILETVLADSGCYIVDGREHRLPVGRLAARASAFRNAIRTGERRGRTNERSAGAPAGDSPGGGGHAVEPGLPADRRAVGPDRGN